MDSYIFPALSQLNPNKGRIYFFSPPMIIHTAKVSRTIAINDSLLLAYLLLTPQHIHPENAKHLSFLCKLEYVLNGRDGSLFAISEIQDSMEEIFYIYASLCNHCCKLLQKLDFLFIAY